MSSAVISLFTIITFALVSCGFPSSSHSSHSPSLVKDAIHIHENGNDFVDEVISHSVDHCPLYSSAEHFVTSLSKQFSSRAGHFHGSDGLLLTSCVKLAGGDVHLYFVPRDQLFVWSPGALGLLRTLSDLVIPGLAGVQLRTLSRSPRVFSVQHLLTTQEADELVEEALALVDEGEDEEGTSLQRSTVGRGDAWTVSAGRTGQTAWLAGSPLAVLLQERVLRLLRLSPEQHAPTDATWVEDLQILKYEENEMFTFHYDIQGDGTGNGSCSGDRCHSYDTANGGTDRFATVMFYLSDVEAGGHTAFWKADEWWDVDFGSAVQRREGGGAALYSPAVAPLLADEVRRACSDSLAVRPQRLNAVLFYSQSPGGAPDWASLHAGCPVALGVKWVANVWVWNGPRKPFWLARQQHHARAGRRAADKFTRDQ